MSTTPEKDAPMPAGVEAMSKQQLWNWFQRTQRAAAETQAMRERFFVTTTGLHPARSHLLGDPSTTIEEQRKRIKGLEQQMGEMQRGYDKKLRKAVAHATASCDSAFGLLRRVRLSCLAVDGAGAPTFVGEVDRGIYDEICALLLEQPLRTLPSVSHSAVGRTEPLAESTGAGELSAKEPGHA